MARPLFLISFLLLSLSTFGQKRVRIDSAEYLYQSTKDGLTLRRLVGSVVLTQETTTIYCDSAYLYNETNRAIAYGHVKVIDTVDSLDLAGDYMEYLGNQRIVKIRDNVILKDDETRLFTDYLDYNRETETGYYQDGGKLLDSANVLTSKRGYYYSLTKKALFLDSVNLDNPDFDLQTDTLNYSTIDKVARSEGKTLGVSAEGDTLSSNKGFLYKSQIKYSEVYDGYIQTEDYHIKGEKLIADDSLKYYQADQKVELTTFGDSLTVYGDHAKYFKNESLAYVYDNAYLKKMMQGDSLFIKGDTIKSVQNELDSQKYLTAFHNVKLYKTDFQGAADSVSYNMMDSTIYMYSAPLIWNTDSQISSDSIRIQLANNRISKMHLRQNSFVISADSAENFNQVKGRNMEVTFNEGFIRKTDVFGNGESIYFAKDVKNNSLTMNKLTCSNMALYFDKNTVTQLRTYKEVDGRLVPETEIVTPEKKLKGFKWLIDQKPTLEQIKGIAPIEKKREPEQLLEKTPLGVKKG